MTITASAGNGGSGGGGGSSDPSVGSPGTAGTAGTAGEITFAEIDVTPVIRDEVVTKIFSRVCSTTADVSSDGGNTITERGFLLSESPNPVV